MTKLGERRLWKARYRRWKSSVIKQEAILTQVAHQMSHQENPTHLQVDLPRYTPTIQ